MMPSFIKAIVKRANPAPVPCGTVAPCRCEVGERRGGAAPGAGWRMAGAASSATAEVCLDRSARQ